MPKFLGSSIALTFALLIGLSNSVGAKVGADCGGLSSLTCGDGEFCQLPPDTCYLTNGTGTCVSVPQDCPMVVQPVCGCDGNTFNNDCLRMRAMMNKAHNEACVHNIVPSIKTK
jgi:Kazal-type serine protease inhibitor domain